MKIFEHGEPSPTTHERYSGPVDLQTLVVSPNPADADVLRAKYAPGTVTNWHSHPGGQYLYVLSEGAWIGNEEDGSVHVGQGTLIVVPPGERHWHGSIDGDEAVFLILNWGMTRWEDTSVAPSLTSASSA